jgi:hypothetical protein
MAMRKLLLLLAFVALFALSSAQPVTQPGIDPSLAQPGISTAPPQPGQSDWLETLKRQWQPTADSFFTTFFGGLTNSQSLACTSPGGVNLVSLLTPAAIAGALVIFAVTMIYMLGELFQSPNLIGLAKEEMRAFVTTIVLIAFVLGTIVTIDEWMGVNRNSNDDVYAYADTAIDAAMVYSRLMTERIASDLATLLVFNTFVHTLYSATVYVGVTTKAMFSFNVGPILKPIVDIIGLVVQFLSVALGEWMLHFVLLCFIKKWTYTVFIPLGILLRSVPQTRSAGDALLAVFWALALVYPLSLIANWEVYKATSFAVLPNETLIQSFFESTGIFGVGLFALIILMTLGSVIMPFLIGVAIPITFAIVKNAIYYVVIISMVLPFINIFLTLTAAKETARAFGSEASFAGFVKVI